MDIKTHHCQYIVENVDSKYILHFFDDNGRLVFEEEFGDKSRKEVEDVGKEFINRGDKFIVSYILEKQSMFWNLTYANKRSNDNILIGRYSLDWIPYKYYIVKDDMSWAMRGDLITLRQDRNGSMATVDLIINQEDDCTNNRGYDFNMRDFNNRVLNNLNRVVKCLTPISYEKSLELGYIYKYRKSLKNNANNVFQSCGTTKFSEEFMTLYREHLSKVEELFNKMKSALL